MHLQLTPAQQARFWRHVVKTEGCWLFKGTPSVPYPTFSVAGYPYYAHRVAYMLQIGPIPDGLMVCHTCDTPRCVRPDHLWVGTAADNQADKWRKGRGPSGDRHGSVTHPERVPRGERHMSRTKPWALQRGAVHYAHVHPESRQGENNGRHKVTAEMVRLIRSRAAQGEDAGALAAEYGVNRSTIHRIVRRETWPMVD